jgi:hypothetical protein
VTTRDPLWVFNLLVAAAVVLTLVVVTQKIRTRRLREAGERLGWRAFGRGEPAARKAPRWSYETGGRSIAVYRRARLCERFDTGRGAGQPGRIFTPA